MKIYFSLLATGLFVFLNISLYAQKNFSVHISGHHAYHFKTNIDENAEGEKGRFGNGAEFRYYFNDADKVLNTAIGISYSRFGFQRNFQWTDATPEREEEFGQFPINYEMWDDVHYISFPFYLNINVGHQWSIGISAALDYPIGTGYFRERSSADRQIIDTHKESFDSTKPYLFNSSIGSSLLLNKKIPLSEIIDLVIEGQFKVYTLLAARSNDYFPHEDNLRPYTAGLSVGVRF